MFPDLSQAQDSISSKKLFQIITNKNFTDVVIDVRTKFEWRETGVVKNSLSLNAYDKDFLKKIKILNKSKIYYIYCHSGVRSLKVQSLMLDLGFKVINVEGGILDWIKNKFPLIKYENNTPVNRLLKSFSHN